MVIMYTSEFSPKLGLIWLLRLSVLLTTILTGIASAQVSVVKTATYFVSNGSSFSSSFSLDSGNTFVALVTKIAHPYTGTDGGISLSGSFSASFAGTYTFDSSIPGVNWIVQDQAQAQEFDPANGLFHADAMGTGIYSVINPTSSNGIFGLTGSTGDYAITLMSLSGVADMVLQAQDQNQGQFTGYEYGAGGQALTTFGPYDGSIALGGLSVGVFTANDLDPALGYGDLFSTSSNPYSGSLGAIDTTLQAVNPTSSVFGVGSHYHGYGLITGPGSLTETFSSGDSVAGSGPAYVGQFAGAFAVFTPIPEPGSVVLIGVAGLAALAVRRRRVSPWVIRPV